jgi:pimeloyl-ACP methyl ester carboxylesterase
MQAQWVPVTGSRMRLQVAGSGPPLVLVHGIAASAFSWRFNYAALVREFRVIIPDLLSVGCENNGKILDHSLAGTAIRLSDALEYLGIEAAAIVGSSYGGSVVMKLAAMRPEKLHRIVLVAPANPFARRYEARVKFFSSRPGKLLSAVFAHLPDQFWQYGIGRMYADRARMDRATGGGYARALRVAGAMRQIGACLNTFAADLQALSPQLATIARIPSLLIWGDRDNVVEPEAATKLQKALGSELAILKGVGHLPYEEAPEQFNSLLSEYLQKAFSPRSHGGHGENPLK